MALQGVGLVLTVVAAACAFGFLGGLFQHYYMRSRSRQAARLEAVRVYPPNPSEIELGTLRGGDRRVVIDGEVCAYRGGPQMGRGSDAGRRITPGGFTNDDASGSGHGNSSNQGATRNEFGPLILLDFTPLCALAATEGNSTLFRFTNTFTINKRAVEIHKE
ncbi:hypothetical protein VE03_02018 [Pseudogymnoascus sp. 23342-1-I1]|nr:hypothetical protein VE03_02018 [Pseudogymnoascus sp. 23342-1-I1]